MSEVKFRRQFSIDKYILDFYSPEYRLAIEVDGGQHFDEDGLKKDQERTKRLESLYVCVLRFDEGVYEVILKATEQIGKMPSPQPSP